MDDLRFGDIECTFCSKKQSDVGKLIAGPNGVFICNYCLSLCNDILKEDNSVKYSLKLGQKIPSPVEIKAFLDQYIIGQEKTKKKIAVAVYNHYKRIEQFKEEDYEDVEIEKSNILLIGPTGTGKTLIASTIAKILDVPFTIADATTLTEAGYVGEDVENIIFNLYEAANYDIEATQKGIIYVDEIDKISKKPSFYSATRDVSGEGVQQALLKLLDGTKANIPSRPGKRYSSREYIQIDTKHILFICGGAFDSLDKIIKERIGKKAVGFKSDIKKKEMGREEEQDILQMVTSEDLEKYGFIPEFIGRLPIISVVSPLTEDELVRILVEPRNALVKQYQKLLKMEQVKLQFTEGGLREISRRALERGSGARGLRAVIEKVMLDVMYEIPSKPDIKECIITEEVVKGLESPRLIKRKGYGVG